ncbi:MAG: PQQ-dependent sugar dehydrogenase [Bauldia sp.]|nr:PQQ-dependent sugar dehydrogenase [Bauldia sp.]
MHRTWQTALAAAAITLSLAAPAAAQGIGVDLVADDFDSPILVTAPAGDDRLFVVEQTGRIWIMEGGARLQTPFLDIAGAVIAGGEQGLLGLAFHPDYAANGRFYLNYTNRAGNTEIARFTVSADANVADPASESEVLEIEDFAGNHNGGWMEFGPDGFLYIATGDGGGGGDPRRNGQDTGALLGKILRIDVDSGSPYAIPPGNPFAGGGGAPEMFVYGVRNPWRNAIDGNDLYIADVGQNAWEEVTVISLDDAGANLGWNVAEGNHCYEQQGCDLSAFTPATYEYSHTEGCSITGGYVYRGAAVPALAGHYIFADYCTGLVRSFVYDGGPPAEVTDWTSAIGLIGNITSFGRDAAGELYITTARGAVYRIVAR